MSVRAKFQCTGISDHKASDGSVEGKNVSFTAVINDGEENKSWSKWTPSGQLTMWITNPDAFNQFEQNKNYYLDISPV